MNDGQASNRLPTELTQAQRARHADVTNEAGLIKSPEQSLPISVCELQILNALALSLQDFVEKEMLWEAIGGRIRIGGDERDAEPAVDYTVTRADFDTAWTNIARLAASEPT